MDHGLIPIHGCRPAGSSFEKIDERRVIFSFFYRRTAEHNDSIAANKAFEMSDADIDNR
ncbi:hypothetical protein [Massilia putida]|uniref:hypothetical protein n=1 Tax=Massilia putida TaxID=1141883 RepID=UPI0012EBF770|nr:hypothetical protein [Massilia putida]